MNEQGAEVLVQAALQGRSHGRRAYRDPDTGARCAMGFLAEAAGVGVSRKHLERPLNELYDLRRDLDMSCPDGCGLGFSDEECLIIHLNDEHEWDLLSIARKLGPDAA